MVARAVEDGSTKKVRSFEAIFRICIQVFSVHLNSCVLPTMITMRIQLGDSRKAVKLKS